MSKLSHLLVGIEAAAGTKVFSGGASNIIMADGSKARNPRRDGLNNRLDASGIDFFDLQIREDTHGRGYNYDVDGPAEKAARAAAQVTLYEIGDDTLAGVTIMEVLKDVMAGKAVVVWDTGKKDAKGKPQFAPAVDTPKIKAIVDGCKAADDPGSKEAYAALAPALVHLDEYARRGSQMRAELRAFVKDSPNVVFVDTEDAAFAAVMQKLTPTSRAS